ncbi:VWA domain-containing protein [Candidatus Woesearchaeota archaeon]|nr:VWA domain-containing protein [Candidatus Woesearchaeota archaeon]
MEVTFTNPVYLWTLLLIPFMILTHIFTLKQVRAAALKFSNFEAIERVSKGNFLGDTYHGFFTNKNLFLLFLRLTVYILLIFSVTGTTIWYIGKASDFDFVIAIDTSTSMLASDFNSTRLEAAKEAASTFVDSVVGQFDIGIVSFASAVFVDREISSNKEELKKTIELMDIKEGGGTNIGDTLITAANLLVTKVPTTKASDKKLEVIILLTDGQSNVGTPVDIATDYVKARDITVHSIGIGTEAGGKFLGLDIITKLDEDGLKKIASAANGKYFRATDKDSLKKVFKEIASYTEKKLALDISWILLIIGLSLLGLEWVLIHTIYRTIP